MALDGLGEQQQRHAVVDFTADGITGDHDGQTPAEDHHGGDGAVHYQLFLCEEHEEGEDRIESDQDECREKHQEEDRLSEAFPESVLGDLV